MEYNPYYINNESYSYSPYRIDNSTNSGYNVSTHNGNNTNG